MSEPLFLKSVMQEKIWGGSRLRDEFHYKIPSETTGEYWAISAHPNGVSEITNGEYSGVKLDDLYHQHPELFEADGSDVFPLLTKILDANEWLSVQVHPSDDYALKYEGELGKTECWYILSAEPGSEIVYGHNAKDKEELTKLIESGNWEHLLRKVKVKAGDFFYVPSGTMHAIGPEIMILETQQSSDTTYRVYDFDRIDIRTGEKRDLHIKESLDVLNIGEPNNSHPSMINISGFRHTTLVSTKFFTVNHWEISNSINFEKFAPYLLVSVINGEGSLTVDGIDYPLSKGSHLILPSNVEKWRISGQLEIISSHI